MLNLELRIFGLAPKFVCDMSFAKEQETKTNSATVTKPEEAHILPNFSLQDLR